MTMMVGGGPQPSKQGGFGRFGSLFMGPSNNNVNMRREAVKMNTMPKRTSGIFSSLLTVEKLDQQKNRFEA